jgi:hypothetical protein
LIVTRIGRAACAFLPRETTIRIENMRAIQARESSPNPHFSDKSAFPAGDFVIQIPG